MNSSNDNIYSASGVAQNKHVRVRALDRGTRSKGNLYSPPQADRNWKPINAFATRLVTHIGASLCICTRVGPKHRHLRIGGGRAVSS